MNDTSIDHTAPKVITRARGWWYFLLLALTNLIWAAQGTAVKYLDPFLGPIAITFLPFYITTLLLIPILVWQRMRNPNRVRPGWSDWWKFAMAGIGGQVLAQLGMTWGISLSLASNGAILSLLIPVISAVLASLMLGERLTALRTVCLGLGLVGVSLMSVADFEHSAFTQRSYMIGNLLIVLGCCGSAFYNVYCKGLLARFGEVEILIFSYITASLASLPLLIWAEPRGKDTADITSIATGLAQMDASAWLAFGFLAVFMYGVSMLLFFYVLEYLPVTVASASLYLLPIFGVLLATNVLDEQLGALSLVGATIVLASTVLIMRYDTTS